MDDRIHGDPEDEALMSDMGAEAAGNIPSGVGIFDVRDQTIHLRYLNDGFYEMIGDRREKRTRFFDTGTIQSVHPDDRPGMLAEVRSAIAEGRPFKYRFRNLDGKGDYLWIGITANHRTLEDGTERFYASYHDVDALVVEQSRLEERGNELTAILGNIPGGVAIFSEKNGRIRIEYANEGFYALHHGSREYWLSQSKNPVDWLTSEDRHIFDEEFLLVNIGEKKQGDVTYRITGEDGELYWVCNQFRKVYEQDGVRYYYASFIDMDGQIAAEQEIRRAKQIYDDATSLSKTVVWTYDIAKRSASVMKSGYSLEVCRRIGFPAVLDNFPESLARYVQSWDSDILRDAFHSIDEGAKTAECEIQFQLLGQSDPQWEHISLKRIEDETGSNAVSCSGRNITAQKLALQEYEDSLRDMLLTAPDALEVLHVDLTKNSYDWTRGIAPTAQDAERPHTLDDLTNVLLERIPDDADRAGFHVFDRNALLESFRRGENRVDYRYRRRNGDGRPRWVSTDIHMIQNPQTSHVEGVIYTIDISREMLQNEIFQIITSRSFDLVALIHLRSRTIEAVYLGDSLPAIYRELLPESGTACDFDTLCAEATRYMDPETRADYENRLSSDYMRDMLDCNNGSYEFTLREDFANGDRGFMYRRFLHYALNDDRDTVLIIESDVTEETMRQHEQLEKAKTEAERDRRIMDSIKIGIAELRFTNRQLVSVGSFNRQMFRILGYDVEGIPQRAEEARGTPLETAFLDAFTYVHPDDKERVRSSFLEHYDDESFSIEPYRLQKSDGSYCWIAEDVELNERGDDYQTYYATYRDVTTELGMREELRQRLKNEQVLREKADAANEAKSEFLSRMSHDIRTPLNGIMGMTYLAQDQDNPPRTAECLTKIDTSAKFLLGLVNDVLDMTKVESGRIELRREYYPIDEFNDYLDAVIKPLCAERNLRFIVDEDVTIDSIPLVDKKCINQILFNLLSNAVKFTPEGGTITYRIRGQRLTENRVLIVHSISDTGIGMSDEFQKKLFEPFTQEKRDDVSENRGSGLGLAIVRNLVDLLGGTITVDSSPGEGTTFTLKFEFDAVPIKPFVADYDHGGDRDPDGVLEGKHLLLCEDHPLNQEIAAALLRKRGAIVDVVEDGQAGLEAFKRSRPGFYAAILMDIRMPVMDGYASTKAIRGLDRSDALTVPIIAMTADAFTDDVRKCLEAGMDDHIAKPIEPSLLYEKLLAALQASG